MKTFHYMNGYKYIHMTNSCYKFSGSAINRQAALANTSCGFNILTLASEESLRQSSTQTYSKVLL